MMQYSEWSTNVTALVAMNRKVTATNGLTLSTGDFLPYGTLTGFGHPDYPTSTTPSASQPPLSEFSAFRHANLRSIPGEENKHQFVTIGSDSLSFGGGTHACPGRFFAAAEIKVVIVEVLKRYDISLGPNGEGDGVGGYQRPKNGQNGLYYFPNPVAKVWFRDRQTN
jgi:gliotoxin biosynthesis cytochrome P450 monooxygenase